MATSTLSSPNVKTIVELLHFPCYISFSGFHCALQGVLGTMGIKNARDHVVPVLHMVEFEAPLLNALARLKWSWA